MYRKLEDAVAAVSQQAESTLKVFAALTDGNLSQTAAAGHRSLGQVAWHIVVTIPEMMNRTGLGLSSVDMEAPPPTDAQAILDGYRNVSAELITALRTKWTDASLAEVDEMYGQQWARGFSLAALVNHEIHHRGQMTVLLRQAGAQVPGVFGPSREEWAQFGMEAPPY